jgi:hypothetical protein
MVGADECREDRADGHRGCVGRVTGMTACCNVRPDLPTMHTLPNRSGGRCAVAKALAAVRAYPPATLPISKPCARPSPDPDLHLMMLVRASGRRESTDRATGKRFIARGRCRTHERATGADAISFFFCASTPSLPYAMYSKVTRAQPSDKRWATPVSVQLQRRLGRGGEPVRISSKRKIRTGKRVKTWTSASSGSVKWGPAWPQIW